MHGRSHAATLGTAPRAGNRNSVSRQTQPVWGRVRSEECRSCATCAFTAVLRSLTVVSLRRGLRPVPARGGTPPLRRIPGDLPSRRLRAPAAERVVPHRMGPQRPWRRPAVALAPESVAAGLPEGVAPVGLSRPTRWKRVSHRAVTSARRRLRHSSPSLARCSAWRPAYSGRRGLTGPQPKRSICEGSGSAAATAAATGATAPTGTGGASSSSAGRRAKSSRSCPSVPVLRSAAAGW
jgi:hypothetical protein